MNPSTVERLVAELTETHRLADGGRVLVRPLLPSDRDELAQGFEQLSPAARRLRFFNPPFHLSTTLLDYLTNLDYDRHFALAAVAIDEPARPGVGVARWIRLSDDPAKAEAAVTVLDAYQGRGVGTLLLMRLAVLAVERGVRTFVGGVLWDNHELLDGLRAVGARIAPDEPGVARVEFDLLPAPPGGPASCTAWSASPAADAVLLAGRRSSGAAPPTAATRGRG